MLCSWVKSKSQTVLLLNAVSSSGMGFQSVRIMWGYQRQVSVYERGDKLPLQASVMYAYLWKLFSDVRAITGYFILTEQHFFLLALSDLKHPYTISASTQAAICPLADSSSKSSASHCAKGLNIFPQHVTTLDQVPSSVTLESLPPLLFTPQRAFST